ncbi:MAG: hypothetical protein VB859_08495, partial [Planctomycetaceae bacterium]
MRSRPRHHRQPRSTRRSRRGLAPLELVLSLPVLLFVMGLMILIGWAATYKVRTQIHAREAAWRSIWRANPRSDAQSLPNPPGFPPPATMSVDRDAGPDLLQPPPTALNLYDAHPVARGPVLVAAAGRPLRVDPDVLDLRKGLMAGHAELDRGFPVLGQMPPRRYHPAVDFQVLDGRWQFWQKGLHDNRSRRSSQLFPDLDSNWQNATLPHTIQFRQIAAQLRNDPERAAMALLESNQELRNYYTGAFGPARDYYPRLPDARTSEPSALSAIADRLVQQIYGQVRPRNGLGQAGIPGRLTEDFLRMY